VGAAGVRGRAGGGRRRGGATGGLTATWLGVAGGRGWQGVRWVAAGAGAVVGRARCLGQWRLEEIVSLTRQSGHGGRLKRTNAKSGEDSSRWSRCEAAQRSSRDSRPWEGQVGLGFYDVRHTTWERGRRAGCLASTGKPAAKKRPSVCIPLSKHCHNCRPVYFALQL
jgi:hypothetical protein